MKYIFLDIDGVLNSANGKKKYDKNPQNEKEFRTVYYQDFPYEYLEVDLLMKLHDIIYKTGAVIVGVSSWFWFKDTPHHDLGYKNVSKVLSLPIYDISDCYTGGIARGNGVISWLKRKEYNPEVDSFVILDDRDEYYNFPIKKINSVTGLTDEDVIYSINVLKSKGIDINSL